MKEIEENGWQACLAGRTARDLMNEISARMKGKTVSLFRVF